MCYDELIQKNTDKIGETLYIEHFFFCNTSELIDEEYQLKIKEYNFCKTFNTPPYPSLQETPAQTVDDFLLIDKEINLYKNSKRRN